MSLRPNRSTPFPQAAQESQLVRGWIVLLQIVSLVGVGHLRRDELSGLEDALKMLGNEKLFRMRPKIVLLVLSALLTLMVDVNPGRLFLSASLFAILVFAFELLFIFN